MSVLLIGGLFLLNFAVSWFNAWGCGKAWVEAQLAGGWPRLMVWSAAVMSACGFTWCYLVLLTLGASGFGYLDAEHADAMFKLGYLLIIGPVLGSGIVITIDSWARAWRQRTLGSGAIAGWNTFAQAYNTYTAIKNVPSFVGDVWEVFGGDGKTKRRSSDDGKGAMALLALFLVIVAIIGGALTTAAIIRHTARNHARAIRASVA